MFVVCGFGLCSASEVVSDCPEPQDERAKRDKMFQEMLDFKINYIAQEMDISGSTRKKFASLYAQMSREKGKIWREMYGVDKKMKSKDLSDQEAFKCIETMNDLRDQEAAIDRRYDDEFSSFLSAKEIIKMHLAEKNFRHKLRSMRDNDRQRRNATKAKRTRRPRHSNEPTLNY